MQDGDEYVFEKVLIADAADAFAFHEAVAEHDGHIWPRTREDIESYAEEGSLFGARLGSGFVGLCYARLCDQEWEVGGLTVPTRLQSLGIGSLLIRLAVAHTLVHADPWEYNQRVIAHVHSENHAPRRLLSSLGFQRREQVRLPGADAPPSMRRDQDGNLVGDVFVFEPAGLTSLCQYFYTFDHRLRDGSTVRIELGAAVTVAELVSALGIMALQVRPRLLSTTNY